MRNLCFAGVIAVASASCAVNDSREQAESTEVVRTLVESIQLDGDTHVLEFHDFGLGRIVMIEKGKIGVKRLDLEAFLSPIEAFQRLRPGVEVPARLLAKASQTPTANTRLTQDSTRLSAADLSATTSIHPVAVPEMTEAALKFPPVKVDRYQLNFVAAHCSDSPDICMTPRGSFTQSGKLNASAQAFEVYADESPITFDLGLQPIDSPNLTIGSGRIEKGSFWALKDSPQFSEVDMPYYYHAVADDPNAHIGFRASFTKCGGVGQKACRNSGEDLTKPLWCQQGSFPVKTDRPWIFYECQEFTDLTWEITDQTTDDVSAHGRLKVAISGHWVFSGHVYNHSTFGQHYAYAVNIGDLIGTANTGYLGGVRGSVLGWLTSADDDETFEIQGFDPNIRDHWYQLANSTSHFHLENHTAGWKAVGQVLVGAGIVVAAVLVGYNFVTGVDWENCSPYWRTDPYSNNITFGEECPEKKK